MTYRSRVAPLCRTIAIGSIAILAALQLSAQTQPTSITVSPLNPSINIGQTRLLPPTSGTSLKLRDGGVISEAATPPPVKPGGAERERQIAEQYGKIPLSFELNQGQLHPDVKFISRGVGYALFLTANGATLTLADGEDGARQVIMMRLAGANPTPQVEGVEPVAGKTNYYKGNDSTAWRTNVPSFAKVKYREIYPGIDIVYYGNQHQLEYDFIVRPGADPNIIGLDFQGGDVALDEAGNLLLRSGSGGTIQFTKPSIYQRAGKDTKQIEGRYAQRPDGRIGFVVSSYDRAKPLVIDPVLQYSTFLGGSRNDFGLSIAVDAAGQAIVAGNTESSNFPTSASFQATPGSVPLFKTSNSAGTWQKSATGIAVPGSVSGVAVDPQVSSTVYATVDSTLFRSTDFGATWNVLNGLSGPTKIAIDPQNSSVIYVLTAFGLVKKSVDGGVSFANANTGLPSILNSLAIDPVNTATLYVATNNGVYKSTDSGTTWNAMNIGLTNLTVRAIAIDPATPATLYAGGFKSVNGGANWSLSLSGQTVNDLAVDPANPSIVYAATDQGVRKSVNGGGSWSTTSSGLPTSDTRIKFLALDPTTPGTVYAVPPQLGVYKTTDGGVNWLPANVGLTGQDVSSIALDRLDSSKLYAGTTFGLDLFVTKFSASGSSVIFSTYLGGAGSDESPKIALDAFGDAYITGRTQSLDFPVLNGFQMTKGGAGATADVFITKLSSTGSLVYSSFLGGSCAKFGGGIAVDALGNAYITGAVVYTSSCAAGGFPLVNALQSTPAGNNEAFVAKVNSSGSALVFSTLLGGSGLDAGVGIAVDASNNILVAGTTGSANFPVVGAFQPTASGGNEGFLTKIASSGSTILYSTFLGGSGSELVRGLALDSFGTAHVTGQTTSANFPVFNALQPVYGGSGDAFIARFDPSLTGSSSLLYSTFFGGSSGDDVQSITVDGAGNTYIVGNSGSTNFPVVDPLPGSVTAFAGFVSKLSSSGSSVLFSSYMIGTQQGTGVGVDAAGSIYVAGTVGGPTVLFPLVDAFQSTFGGNTDGFVLKMGNPPAADLAISKSPSTGPLYVGQNVTYTILISNSGPSGANAVTLSDPLPAGVTFVSAGTTQGSCSGSTTVICNLGSIANGGATTVTIVVTPNAVGSLSNTASVSATETDPVTGNNSSTAVATIGQAGQTITFGALSNKTFGDAPFAVSATASSGLAVNFAGSGACTVAGNTVTLTGVGSCTITASQAGNTNYSAAPNVAQPFTIGQAGQTITFGALSNKTFGDAPFAVSATASSGLAVSFAGSGACTVAGNTVTLTGAGSCTITASQAGNAYYSASLGVAQSFSIAEPPVVTSGVIVLQPGPTEGKDTRMTRGGQGTESRANLNSGSARNLLTGQVGNHGGIERSLLQFALPTLAPGAIIQSARLGLTTDSTDPSSVIEVYQMTQAWLEGTNDGTEPGPPIPDGATWQTYEGVNPWPGISGFRALDGGGYNASSASITVPLGSALVSNPAPGVLNWINLDPARVLGWFNGTLANNGVLIRSQNELSGSTSQVFASSDHPTASWRPILELTITSAAGQTITFGALANKTFGDPPFAVSATASSGLAVSFAASGACTVAGNTVTLTGVGSCTITASQAGNTNYSAATNVAQPFTIGQAGQTITFGALANKTFGDAPFAVSATASSGLAVSFGASGPCTVAGNTVTLTGVGSCTITASQTGNTNYSAALDVAQPFTIGQAGQTITFGALANKTFGDAPFAVSATASSGLAVSFAASGPCSVAGNTVTLTGVGSCTITASQIGNTNYSPAPNVPQPFTITQASQTITFAPLANKTFGDPPFAVTATATSSLPVSFAASGTCTVAGNTVTLTGAGTCTITASQAGNTNYSTAPNVPQPFTINQAAQTITFAPLASKTFGNPPFALSATATSGLPVSFAASGTCTVAGNTVTLTGAGTCTITASQAGNTNYSAAPNVPQPFTINQAAQTITFAPLASKTFGDPPFAVGATASSGLPVSFAASGTCTVSGNTVTLTGAGNCTITASQTGNANYSPAPNVAQSFPIALQVPTSIAACQNGGWQNLHRADGSSFKNQGECIRYFNTGK